MAWHSPAVAAWEGRGHLPDAGRVQDLHGRRRRHGARDPGAARWCCTGSRAAPSTSDHVVDALAEHRRVLLFDMIGYGLSAKPDRAYTLDLQADVAQAFVADAA